jgi:hypothetical protein
VRSHADALLAQLGSLVESLDPSIYARACPTAMGSTIGRHVRHTLDHFAALLLATDYHADLARSDRPVIDYDHRERDTPIEHDPLTALAAIARLRGHLAQLQDEVLTGCVTVRLMLDADGRTADLPSTFIREVSFAAHHALHHHAIIRMIIEATHPCGRDGSLVLPGVQHFGVAPATLNHESLGGRGAATPSGSACCAHHR